MRSLLSLCSLSIATSIACAQPAPDYGFEWRTIGAPGNAPAVQSPLFPRLTLPVGQVNYEYRMARTEVTNEQWLEFVVSYSQFHTDFSVLNDMSFTGPDIYRLGDTPADYGWHVDPGGEPAAARMSWFYAARYCNWLHNGKVNQPWAFESGAYTLGGYQQLPDGTWTGQLTRSPGALFWIPGVDEWVKGMYYDPNKHGLGQPGYYLYPTSSDELPVGGPPGTPGAQTSAGIWPSNDPWYVPVGSYPHVQSPWGLLDGSGGESEYVEAITNRWAKYGSHRRDTLWLVWDRLDYYSGVFPDAPNAGLRIASAVPSPGGIVAAGLLGLCLLNRRRRHVEVAW